MDDFDIYILDKNFVRVCYVEDFESMIWTDRYKDVGDFEIYLSADSNVLVYAEHGNYVQIVGNDRLMVIESTEIETDIENGNHLKITGRSLESILDRRIIWFRTDVENITAQDLIKKLINENVISPTIEGRAISNFIFVDNTDERLLEFEIESAQFLGDNLLEAISDICNKFDLGFRLLYSGGSFYFNLYYGADRSFNQIINPWVIFSPSYDNLKSSNYLEDSTNIRNVNLVAGEEPDKDSDKARKMVYVGTASGLERRELFTDGSSIKQDYKETTFDENGEETGEEEKHLTDQEHLDKLKELGFSELSKKDNSLVQTFEGEVSPNRNFKLNEDYELGDIVQVENEYGLGIAARVVEIIFSQSTSGIEVYPTFSFVVGSEET